MKLEEIEALLDKITPFPWLDYYISTGESWVREYRINNPEIGVDIARCGNDYTFSKSDSVFIAAAPMIIRELVERVRDLERTLNNKFVGHLLARNEELQRRVRLLEDVLERCESLADNGVDDPAGPYNVLQQVVNTICAVLYAKEQDDASNDS